MGETQASLKKFLRVILSNIQPLVGSHHSFLCVTDPNDSLDPCNIFQASQSNAKNKMSILSHSAYLTVRKGHYLQRYQAGKTQAGRQAGRQVGSDLSLGSTLSLTHSRWPVLLRTIKLKKISLMGITVSRCLILNRDTSKGSLSLFLQKTNWMPLCSWVTAAQSLPEALVCDQATDSVWKKHIRSGPQVQVLSTWRVKGSE